MFNQGKQSQKSIEDVFGVVHSPGNYCFNREKSKTLDGYVTIPI